MPSKTPPVTWVTIAPTRKTNETAKNILPIWIRCRFVLMLTIFSVCSLGPEKLSLRLYYGADQVALFLAGVGVALSL